MGSSSTGSGTGGTEGSPAVRPPLLGLPYEASTGEKLRVVRLPNGAGLAAHRAAWWELAAAACEGNVFYEPWMLEPALAELRGDTAVDVVLVYEDGAGRAGRLCALLPVERRTPDWRRPAPAIALWKHVHCFLCTPLVRPDVGPAALEAFFHWLEHGPARAPWMAFDHVAADGPFMRLLEGELTRRRRRAVELERVERALVSTGESADAYLRAAMPRKRRHEVERLERRLRDRGALRYRMLAPGDAGSLDGWLDAFLALEASGWKGGTGSAMDDRPGERRFFRAAAHGAFRAGRLMLLAALLDGRPIAMKCNFLTDAAQGGGFAFKIAFDESLAAFSPGVLLEFENLRRIHAAPRLRWMDSCAKPGHPMIERIWRERRVIADVLVSTGRQGGSAALAVFDAVRSLKQRSGALARAPRRDEQERS